MPKVRALCSAGITQPRRSYDPVRLPSWPLPSATLRTLPSPMTGLLRLPEGSEGRRFVVGWRRRLPAVARVSRGRLRPVRFLCWGGVAAILGRRRKGSAWDPPPAQRFGARPRAIDRRYRGFVFPQFVVPTKRIRIDDWKSKFVKTSEHTFAGADLHGRERSAIAGELTAWSRTHCYPYPRQNITIHSSPPSSATI